MIAALFQSELFENGLCGDVQLCVLVLLRLDFARWARIAVGAEVTAVLCGSYAAQAPYLLDQLGVSEPVAPHLTVVIFLWTSLIGGVVLIPSLLFLFTVFKRAPIDELLSRFDEDRSLHHGMVGANILEGAGLLELVRKFCILVEIA